MEDSAAALLEAALAHHQAGKGDAAERLYREVLAREPRNAVAHHNLAVLAMQSGRGIAAALPSFRAAWEAEPTHQQHWISLLRALVEAGDLERARAVHDEGVRLGLQGPSVDALAGRGLAPARPPAAGGATPSPAEIAAMTDLARDGRFADVERVAREWTERYPASAAAWKALGWALVEADRASEAMIALQEAARREPRDAETLELLGRSFLRMAMLKEAQGAFQGALAGDPGNAGAHLGLARALQEQRRNDEAIEHYRRALAIRADFAAAYHALCRLLFELRRIDEAEAFTRRYIEAAPRDAEARVNLGAILNNRGRLDEAMRSYAEALEAQPASLAIRSARLLTGNLADAPSSARRDEAALYGRYATQQAQPFADWRCARDPRRLVVGLVSGDLGDHPVGYFLESTLAAADRDRIEWVAYPTFHRRDDVARRIESRVSKWQSLAGLDDRRAAARIRDDGVHVLLDLAGHTAGNRLAVFAWRPAPVQASWLGYFATTGVEQMDYLIADAACVPPGDEAQFTETIWRLPETRLCFTPPDGAPPPSALPALERGHVTFGSFQKLTKLNHDLLRAWARVLEATPGARLRMQAHGLGTAAIAELLGKRMQAAGIDLRRVSLCEGMDRAAYLAAHAEVDMILDTFPFPGGTTTCEALWMGVPTVTLAGRTLIARQGVSMLTAAGLPDWIAGSIDDYVELAARKAGDVAALAKLRAQMRETVARSALFDAPRFARRLEEALRGMWSARKVSA